jgi:OOP family OmpA-OmpF porin
MLKLTSISLLITMALTNIMSAQNLLLNPSFEEGAVCDGNTEQTSVPKDWKVLAGSPQFINPGCPMSQDEKTYIQSMKLPNPAAGKVYAGLGIDIEGEYLQGTLSKPLTENTRYWVKLRMRLPIKFCFTPIDELGIVLTDSIFKTTEDYTTIDMPSLKLVSNDLSPIKEQYQWQEISAIYTAKGGENLILIGNFKDNNVSNFKKRTESPENKENSGNPEENIQNGENQGEDEEVINKICSYIFIDMITVEEFKELSLKNYNPASEMSLGERLVMKDVEFETGLEKLKESSFASLDALAKQLTNNSSLKLEVSGHTDNTGDENTNRVFSKSRAQAVVNYLVSKGAKASQFTVEGKGSSMNIAQNSSDANKKKNRRIEIKVLEQ